MDILTYFISKKVTYDNNRLVALAKNREGHIVDATCRDYIIDILKQSYTHLYFLPKGRFASKKYWHRKTFIVTRYDRQFTLSSTSLSYRDRK